MAVAQVRSLAPELPYAVGWAIKEKKVVIERLKFCDLQVKVFCAKLPGFELISVVNRQFLSSNFIFFFVIVFHPSLIPYFSLFSLTAFAFLFVWFCLSVR